MLTQDQVEQFKRDGFLVVPGFSGGDQVDKLLHRGAELVDEYDLKKDFVLGSQTNTTNDYFLKSASDIGFFFEKNAFDENGQLAKPKSIAVHKLGHALHDLDPVFKAWTRDNSKVRAILKDLGYQRPMPVQSLFHFKPSGIGSAVPVHQDGTYLATEPQSVIAFWLSLKPADQTNGCLWVLPGSHTHGVRRRFRHRGCNMDYDHPLPEEFTVKQGYVPVEVEAGTLVLLHAAVAHYSDPNTSGHSRPALVVHFVEGTDKYKWSGDNWLQRNETLPFTPLYDDEMPHQNNTVIAG